MERKVVQKWRTNLLSRTFVAKSARCPRSWRVLHWVVWPGGKFFGWKNRVHFSTSVLANLVTVLYFFQTGIITYRCALHVDVKARLVNPLKNCKRKFLHWSIKCATWNLHSTSLAITWTGRSNFRRHHGVEISNSAIHLGHRTAPTPKMKRWGATASRPPSNTS